MLSGTWVSAVDNCQWSGANSNSLYGTALDNSSALYGTAHDNSSALYGTNNNSACWATACSNVPDTWADPSATLTDAEWARALEALAVRQKLLSAKAQQLPLPDGMALLGANLSAAHGFDYGLLSQLSDVAAAPGGLHQTWPQQAKRARAPQAKPKAAKKPARLPTVSTAGSAAAANQRTGGKALTSGGKALTSSPVAAAEHCGAGCGQEWDRGEGSMDPRHAPGPPSNKLFVGNINSKVTEVELRELMGPCGEITSVKVGSSRALSCS
jgi:hypothetical protein